MSAPFVTAVPALSCYTTNLVPCLQSHIPDIAERLARSVHLRVRADGEGGLLGFSHHQRVDRGEDGLELACKGSPSWCKAQEGLAAELTASGTVLASANTRYLPWSPHFGTADVSHWILLTDRRRDQWRVTDHFQALLPQGEQLPFTGWFDDRELQRALTPVVTQGPELVMRNRYALGGDMDVSPPHHYSWLVRQPAPVHRAAEGGWIDDPHAALSHVCDRLAEDGLALERNSLDVWSATRHHQHRIAYLARNGQLSGAEAEAASAAWGELPRAVRFAAASAARGRPRPGVMVKTFHDVMSTLSLVYRTGADR
ncbi:hypothetical protein GCM10007079_25860 [Nocardiopsis terrae]|uniref:Uncharacterized protein n=1 Tax=Nocardiopsis terrae TaxID=372655 RepID=A0ABR9HFK7_9ACTN|nr:hypothetical protein [Nocardiopsis terrae]MBE1457810.1 hypothetical protein [Nocardiopsis terrae]GHC84152.1 hypothetical protein GCM10007079_25860 [Nocardiopsis terrae]